MLSTTGATADEIWVHEHLLAFLEEYCRGMTLRDAREWYADSLGAEMPAFPYEEKNAP